MEQARIGIAAGYASILSGIDAVPPTLRRTPALKRMIHTSSIVSTYGYLEQWVDTLVMHVSEAYRSLFKRPEGYPTRVGDSYRTLALEHLLGRGGWTRAEVDHAVILSSLDVKNDAWPGYQWPMLTKKTSNCYHSTVAELLRRVDVDVSSLGGSRESDKLDYIEKANFESALEDLVALRNTVAHSFDAANDLLDLDIQRAYVEVVRDYLLLMERDITKSLTDLALAAGLLSGVGEVVHVWSHSLGVDLHRGTLNDGDQIILQKKTRSTLCTIKGLVNARQDSVSSVRGRGKTQVGIRLDVQTHARMDKAQVLRTKVANHEWVRQYLS